MRPTPTDATADQRLPNFHNCASNQPTAANRHRFPDHRRQLCAAAVQRWPPDLCQPHTTAVAGVCNRHTAAAAAVDRRPLPTLH